MFIANDICRWARAANGKKLPIMKICSISTEGSEFTEFQVKCKYVALFDRLDSEFHNYLVLWRSKRIRFNQNQETSHTEKSTRA